MVLRLQNGSYQFGVRMRGWTDNQRRMSRLNLPYLRELRPDEARFINYFSIVHSIVGENSTRENTLASGKRLSPVLTQITQDILLGKRDPATWALKRKRTNQEQKESTQ